MDTKSLNTLEFPKVLAQLEAHTAFSASAKLARALRPTDNLNFARKRQARTSEAFRLLSEHADVSVGGARDVRPQVQLAARGGVLAPEDLLDVKATLAAGRDLFRFFDKLAIDLPNLTEISLPLDPPEGLIEAVSLVLDDKGAVRDSASQELRVIRSNLKSANSRAMEKLTHIINSPNTGRMLQEPIITKRAERYVVPLKAEYKGRMQCVVQDQSASGATLFVEPLSVVELNNDRISLSKAEQEEVQRILVELSGRIGAHARAIQELVHQLAVLDLAFACAKYAFALKAAAPILVPFPQEPAVLPDPILRITQARHPLLDPKTVVPIDIFLEKGTRALVITGPNTGGKTISLKTAGLMALMAQSGLHIPAQSGSQLCVFKNVYADIGDEQSIEQSLSTFSGHVTNIVRILKKANRKTLVLLDELGAGTDPQEGSALARAILTFMIRRHIPTLVATHYPELKAFAHNADGVLNASVEFDADTLMPTYRLLTGVPGRSNALAIAKQLGVSAEILDDARAMIDPNDLQADQLLDGIQEQLEQARVERARAEMLRVEIEDAKHELQLHLSGIEEERLKVLDDARQQAEAEAEKLYAEINAIRKETGKPEKTTQKKKELRKRVDKLKGELNEPLERTRFQEEGRRPLREGDRVRVRKLDTDGTVVGILDGSVEVQVGKMRMKVDVGDIERSKRPEKIEKSPASGHAIVEASDIFSPSPGTELMLIGMNSEDALMTLDRYLDAAHAAGLPYVRIVHGKGTGTLRRAVRKALGGSRLVVRWERALDAEGGEGATVAFLEDTS